jgi:hypothetical protein
MKREKTTTQKQYNRNPKRIAISLLGMSVKAKYMNESHLVVEQNVKSHPQPQQVYPPVHVEQ